MDKEQVLIPLLLLTTAAHVASQAYNYEYGVADQVSNTAFAKTEARDEMGRVEGSYKLNLPDGRVQIVTYVADEKGYRAEVTYKGEPVHPPPQHLLVPHHVQHHQYSPIDGAINQYTERFVPRLHITPY